MVPQVTLAHSKVDNDSISAYLGVTSRLDPPMVVHCAYKKICLWYGTTLMEKSWLAASQDVHGLGTNKNEKSMTSCCGWEVGENHWKWTFWSHMIWKYWSLGSSPQIATIIDSPSMDVSHYLCHLSETYSIRFWAKSHTSRFCSHVWAPKARVTGFHIKVHLAVISAECWPMSATEDNTDLCDLASFSLVVIGPHVLMHWKPHHAVGRNSSKRSSLIPNVVLHSKPAIFLPVPLPMNF